MELELVYRVGWLVFWLVFAFLAGVSVGSFLNVCVARLPFEKSLLWPGSRCGACLQPIQARDNVPLLGYLRLRGRCRMCGAAFSVRYFLMELLTGLAFAGLFYVELFGNVFHLEVVRRFQGLGPDSFWALSLFFHHAVLLSFLIVVFVSDLDHMEIPLTVTVTGTLVGLVLATLFPWPFPDPVVQPPGMQPAFPTQYGLYPWPVWYPLPAWLPPGSWQLGLATGLAGALAGMVMLRSVRFLFGLGRGIEGLGVGDADLMMMAGAFVGWQPVVLAFFVAVFPALLLGIGQLLRKGDQAMPFGPPLAMGVMLALLGWPWLGEHFRVLFFAPDFLIILSVGGAVILLATAFLLRLVRGTLPHGET